MTKKIELAGLVIEIHSLYDSLPNTAEYETDADADFTVEITEADIEAEYKKSVAEAEYEGLPYPGFSAESLENTAIYRKIAMKLPAYDALVFHGSAVAAGDRAYLFTAKSGTGKTTHTALWLKNIGGSYVVNGDKPIIRMIDGTPYVCGTPWMGKEGYGCNKTVPLAALCFLNRGEENRIEKTDFGSVFPRLMGQAYRPPDGMLLARTLKILEAVGKAVPIYELYCNMEDEAATVSYRGMTE